NTGALAPVANPLTCGTATASTALTPFTSPFAPFKSPSSSFTVDRDGKGGACPSTPPFSLAQSTSGQPPAAGAFGNTSFPLSLGTVVTRVAIGVDPYTSRVIAASSPLTTIVKGVPVRLKNVSVTVNRPNFLYNPTNCGALASESVLTSTFGATQSLSSPFQVTACGALHFTPTFTASTNANASNAGAPHLQV